MLNKEKGVHPDSYRESDIRPRQNELVGLACRYGRARDGDSGILVC